MTTGSRLQVTSLSLATPLPDETRENQDNYLHIDGAGQAEYLTDQRVVQSHIKGWPQNYWRLAVLDGLGGHAYGRQAAERAVQGLAKIPACSDLEDLAGQLETLHHRLQTEFNGLEKKPGTALSLLEVQPNGEAQLFHAGDTRLYAINNQSVECLTIDHVPATRLLRLGVLEEADWQHQVHHQSRPFLSQAFILGNNLGGNDPNKPEWSDHLTTLDTQPLPPSLRELGDRRRIHLEKGYTYLLASDGLWDLEDPHQFVAKWPKWLGAEPDLATGLARLFTELTRTLQTQGFDQADNATAIAFRRLY